MASPRGMWVRLRELSRDVSKEELEVLTGLRQDEIEAIPVLAAREEEAERRREALRRAAQRG